MKEEAQNNEEEKTFSNPEEAPPTPKKIKSVGGILFRGFIYSVFFVLLLIASASLLLDYYFPAEKVRVIAEDQLSKKLRLPLRIQKLDYSLFSGIQIDGLALGSSSSPVAQIKKVILDYDLIQLLRGKLVISQILVDRPQLTAVSKNGVWNFQPLLDLGNSTPPSNNKGKALPALPLAEVDIRQVLIRQASAHLDQDGKLSGHINGLTLEAQGKAASLDAIDLKLKVLLNPDKDPNIAFKSSSDESFQSSAFSNLEFSVKDLNQLSISGIFGLEKTRIKMSGPTPPLPDMVVETTAIVSMQPEVLDLKKLWLSFGKNNRIRVSGSVANFSQDPSFKVMVDEASFRLGDLIGWGKQWLPPLSGQGILKAKSVKISGQLSRFALKNLDVNGGTLSVKNLQMNHSGQNIRLEGMNANLELKEVALEDSRLRKADISLNMQSKKVKVQKAEIKDWDQSLNVIATGKDDIFVKFSTDMESLHYDHPETKEIYIPVHAGGSGHLKKSDLDNLEVSYRLGTLASGAVTGNAKNFGKSSVLLDQNLSINLAEMANRLPKKITADLPENLKGEAHAQTSLSGRLDEKYFPVELKGQVNLGLAGLTAHRKQPSIKITELNAQASFPLEFNANKGIRISNLEFHTDLQSAEALDTWKMVTLKLDTKLAVKGFHNLKPDFGTLPVQMESSITLENLNSSTLSLAGLRSEARLKGDLLPDDARNMRVEGNLSLKNVSAREMLKTDDWFSQFNLDVHDKSLTRVRLSQKTRIKKPSFHRGGMVIELESANLESLSRQNLKDGNINLDTFLLQIPDIANARLKATINEWGKNFEIDGKLEKLRLDSLWVHLPDTLRSELGDLKAGGVLDVRLKAKGNLPANLSGSTTAPELLRAQLFAPASAETSMEFLLSNGFLENKNIRGESLNFKTRLMFKDGDGDLSGNFSGELEGLGEIPLNPEFEFRYTLESQDSVRVQQHKLKLTHRGVQHSLEGYINGLKPFIEGRRQIRTKELLSKLNIKLGTTNTFDITQAITANPDLLFACLKAEGTIQSKTIFQQSAGKSLSLDGNIEFDQFSLHLPSGIALKNLSGTFPYSKTLLLDQEQLKNKSVEFFAAQKKFFTPLRNFSPYKNIIRADSFEVKGHVLKDIGLDIVFKDNRFMMEKFLFDVLGGTVAGNLFLIQDQRGPVIEFSTEFARIDSSKLLALPASKNTDSEIDGNLQVQLEIQTGSENQPVSLNQLTVKIAITRIGAQTLDRLLLFLDPEESKPAIMDTRAKLKLATPHQVKITLANGNLNVEAWLKSDLLGIFKAPELKRVPVEKLKRFVTINEQLQALKGLEQISSYLSARGIKFEEEKMILQN